MTKSKKSLREHEYKKERRRIQNFVRRAEKRGYKFIKDVLPKIPKNITQASVNVLKKITPEALYKSARYVTQEGVELAGIVARDLERSAAGRRAAETRKKNKSVKVTGILPSDFNDAEYIINQFKSDIQQAYSLAITYEPFLKRSQNFISKQYDHAAELQNLILAILEQAIAQYGEESVAENIQNNAETLNHELQVAMIDYRDENWQPSLQTITEILMQRSLTLEESIEIGYATEQTWGV